MISCNRILRFVAVCLQVAVLAFSLAGCGNAENQVDSASNVIEDIVAQAEIQMYEDGVADFEEIGLGEIPSILDAADDNQSYYFYFGRTTCLYCRKFVIENERDLQKVPNFYYIDTEKLPDTESESLKEYGISTVPAILKSTDSLNLELQDIYEFEDMIRGESE